MDAALDPSITDLVLMTASQVGKTELLLNIIGYYIHQDPSPILVILPTLELAEAFSKDRLAPMLRDSPVLAGLVKDPRARDSNNTLLHKSFPGGHITLTGANAPASLSMRPIRILLCDEVDRYPASAGTEGDPIALAKKRTSTFWNRKTILTSTPTIRNASRIELAYQTTDQRRFFVPCPACGHFQTLEWDRVTFDRDAAGRAHSTRYTCASCEKPIGEASKRALLEAGEWRPTASAVSPTTAGFHLSELYSPWRRWQETAEDFLDAKRNTETLKTWINTALGQSWEEQGETVEHSNLFARRQPYAAEVPDEVLVLTAGIDVQDDRLEVEIVGWAAEEESFGIDYRIIHGDPSLRETWQALTDTLNLTFGRTDETRARIAAACIDSGGHFTQFVYRYARENAQRRIYATKGMAGAGRPIVAAPMRRRSGRNRRPVDLYIIGTDEAKGLLYSRLRITAPGPGYCHFPTRPEYDEEFFAQLTAETVVTRYRNGFPIRTWKKTRPRNEALDCRILAIAALYILNPAWEALIRRTAKAHAAPKPPRPEDRLDERLRRSHHPADPWRKFLPT